jgi:hypothetical protein
MGYYIKAKYARERTGMNRMDFATWLGSSEGYIKNIESARNGKERRYSRAKEALITEKASLPLGYFVSGDVHKIAESDTEVFHRLFPSAKVSKVSREDVLLFIDAIAKFKNM